MFPMQPSIRFHKTMVESGVHRNHSRHLPEQNETNEVERNSTICRIPDRSHEIGLPHEISIKTVKFLDSRIKRYLWPSPQICPAAKSPSKTKSRYQTMAPERAFYSTRRQTRTKALETIPPIWNACNAIHALEFKSKRSTLVHTFILYIFDGFWRDVPSAVCQS